MNFIQYGLGRIFTEIDHGILNKAFKVHPRFNSGGLETLEEVIRNQVIRQRILTDCDVSGGQQVLIALSSHGPTYLENGLMYRIPLSATGGRHIISAMAIERQGHNATGGGVNPINAIIGPTPTGTAEVELVGNNTVVANEWVPGSGDFLRCVLGNDAELANFHQGAMHDFGTMCVMATEGIIYRKLHTLLGEHGRNGGQVNSKEEGVISGYSDSMDQYNDFIRNNWRKIAKMSDSMTQRRFLGMGIPA
jgi:hypothetical protein